MLDAKQDRHCPLSAGLNSSLMGFIMGTLKIFGRLGGVLALIFLIVALLRQLVTLVTFLIAAIKIAVVVIFIAILVMIVLAIFRDRSQRRREREEL